MNCELAGRLLDGYLENELGPRDRLLLEKHVATCRRCADDLRRRPAFERDVWRSLTTSVRSLALSSAASTRIVRAAEQSLRRAVWERRVVVIFQLVGGAMATSLLVVGLLVLLGQIPVPTDLKPRALFPANQPALSEPRPGVVPAATQPAPQVVDTTVNWTPRVSFRLQPSQLYAGEPFTMTVFLKSEAPGPVETVHLDLDVSGPSGFYRFGWTVDGPLPAHDVTIFRITPGLLAGPCQEQYLISPADIFGFPGVYTVQLVVSDPVVASH
jgi:hypothetical protein